VLLWALASAVTSSAAASVAHAAVRPRAGKVNFTIERTPASFSGPLPR
jgi:hypothetical protein